MRHINDIIAVNKAAQAKHDAKLPERTITLKESELEQLVTALKTARASLNDVLVSGLHAQQRKNITNTDLPAIVGALAKGEASLFYRAQ